MARLKFANRVKETSTTSGTGTYTLAGAVTGFQAFSAGIGDGNTCYYCADDGTNWEVGLGTYTLSGTTLARTTILASSNSGSAVSWSGNSKNVYVVMPADANAAVTPNRVLPPFHVDGLGLTYTSATQLSVASGHARDSTDAYDLALASATTLDITSLGAQNGTDEFTSAKTATTNGTATVTASGSIISELGPITHATITLSSATTTVTASADVRGWLSVGDLIGNTTTYGYSRVTAIDVAGTTITVIAAHPGGNITAGTAAMKIENPTIKISTHAANQINTINAAGTSLVLVNTEATLSGVAIKWGVEANSTWYAVWLTLESGTVGTRLSTQRTAIYSSSTFKRRIGWVYNNASGDIVAWSSTRRGTITTVQWEGYQVTDATELVANVSPTLNTWTKVDASPVSPPTAVRFQLVVHGSNPASSTNYYVRKAGFGLSTTTRPMFVVVLISGASSSLAVVDCDAAQQFEYSADHATSHTIISLVAYDDDLTK